MRRHVTDPWRQALLIGLTSASIAFASEESEARPKIGALAKTSLSPQAPKTPGLLRSGLIDSAPQVRAAAARVGHAMGARWLLPDLKSALAREDQQEATKEMRWAIDDLDANDELSAKPLGSDARVTRTPFGYPAGFFAAVLAVTNCKGKTDAVEGADIEFRPGGRPKALQMMRTAPSSDNCRNALELLGLNTLSFAGEKLVRLVLPDQPEFLTCAASYDSYDGPAAVRLGISRPGERGQTQADKRIQEPKKVKNRPPVYPDSAKESRVQGVVIMEAMIAPTGCIGRIKILREVDPPLDFAALTAVSAWAYTPALLDGVPVPVVMTVTMNFRLN